MNVFMKILAVAVIPVLSGIISGCIGTSEPSTYPAPPEVTARKTEPLKIDGVLDEKEWYAAEVYSLKTARESWKNQHPALRAVYEGKVVNPGKIRLLYDEKYLYVGIEFKDDDLQAQAKKNQEMLCNKGDVAELFLKPVNANYYWEIHLSPANQHNVLFYPGRGHHLLPSVIQKESPLKGIVSAVSFCGTLNDSSDRDRFWSAELAIPLAELAKKGNALKSGVSWRILFARYDYTCHQLGKELSAFPELRYFNFHSHEEYAFLYLK